MSDAGLPAEREGAAVPSAPFPLPAAPADIWCRRTRTLCGQTTPTQILTTWSWAICSGRHSCGRTSARVPRTPWARLRAMGERGHRTKAATRLGPSRGSSWRGCRGEKHVLQMHAPHPLRTHLTTACEPTDDVTLPVPPAPLPAPHALLRLAWEPKASSHHWAGLGLPNGAVPWRKYSWIN